MPYYIRDWDQAVHYKYRNAPWVKLHKSILHSQWWIRSSPTTKLVAITLLVTAEQSTGRVLVEPRDVKLLAQLKKEPDFKQLIDYGFLVDDASKMLASCYHSASTIERKIDIKKERKEETHVVQGTTKPQKLNGTPWWSSEDATIAKGREVGIEARPGENWFSLRERIKQKMS